MNPVRQMFLFYYIQHVRSETLLSIPNLIPVMFWVTPGAGDEEAEVAPENTTVGMGTTREVDDEENGIATNHIEANPPKWTILPRGIDGSLVFRYESCCKFIWNHWLIQSGYMI